MDAGQEDFKMLLNPVIKNEFPLAWYPAEAAVDFE